MYPGESARGGEQYPEHLVPRGQERAFSGESARGGERRPPSTRYPDDPGSPLAVAPEGPTDEVSASQRPKAAFKEHAWPVTSNCSCHARCQSLPHPGRRAWGYLMHGSHPAPSGAPRDSIVRPKAFRLPRCYGRQTRSGGHAGPLYGCPVGPLHGARYQRHHDD